MHKVNLKPLSANQAWQGKRFKSAAYKAFERDCLLMMPKGVEIPEGQLTVAIRFGFSNAASDIDNPLKMLIDCLCKKYEFDDKRIYILGAQKMIVKKGAEFFEFDIAGMPKDA